MSAMNTTVRLFKETAREIGQDDIANLGASLAYYTVFSLAPVLVIAVGVAGLVLGPEAATGQLQVELGRLIGEAGAEVVGSLVASAGEFGKGTCATIVGAITLMIGASGAFVQLQTALNRVWGCEAESKGWAAFVKRRLVSFGMVLVIGFLLLVSTVLTAVITGVGEWMVGTFAIPESALQLLNLATSFLVTTLLFAMIYKILPDAKIAWSDVWVGALVTSLLFAIGKYAIGMYIGHSAVASTFGAAGSLVVVLMWVYYSSQLLLIGAEFTQVWSRVRGSRAREPGGDLCDAPPPEGGVKKRVTEPIEPIGAT